MSSLSEYDKAERQRLLEENINLRADNEGYRKDVEELVIQALVMQSLINEQNGTIQKLVKRLNLKVVR
jgi:hypothetical protein